MRAHALIGLYARTDTHVIMHAYAGTQQCTAHSPDHRLTSPVQFQICIADISAGLLQSKPASSAVTAILKKG